MIPLDQIKTGVPAELAGLRQWVAYRSLPARNRPGKTDKLPGNPHTGANASVSDPATWGTLDQAVARAVAGRLAGVGFVFTETDPFTGIDLDGCIGADGQVAPWAGEIVRLLHSYTEVSPGGKGLHVIVRGAPPPGGRRRGQVELYDRGRFFTPAGRQVLAKMMGSIFTRCSVPRRMPTQQDSSGGVMYSWR